MSFFVDRKNKMNTKVKGRPPSKTGKQSWDKNFIEDLYKTLDQSSDPEYKYREHIEGLEKFYSDGISEDYSILDKQLKKRLKGN